MNKWLGALLLCILLWGFTSCKLLKHPSGKEGNKDTVSISGTFIGPVNDSGNVAVVKKDTAAVPVMSAEKKLLIENVTPVWQKHLNYTTFSAKVKMHYEEKDNQKDFTAHIRIRKDSVIWISISALGGMLPVARISINHDSLKMINFIDKEAILLPLSQATRLLPVPADFSTLQNFITGQPLRTEGWISDAKDSSDSWTIQAEDSNYIQQLVYNKSDSSLRSGQMRTHSINSPLGFIQYMRYEMAGNKKFSYQRAMHIENAGASYVLDMDFTNADFDQELDYSFSVPRNYSINPRK